jgi:hypothetical protein
MSWFTSLRDSVTAPIQTVVKNVVSNVAPIVQKTAGVIPQQFANSIAPGLAGGMPQVQPSPVAVSTVAAATPSTTGAGSFSWGSLVSMVQNPAQPSTATTAAQPAAIKPIFIYGGIGLVLMILLLRGAK